MSTALATLNAPRRWLRGLHDWAAHWAETRRRPVALRLGGVLVPKAL